MQPSEREMAQKEMPGSVRSSGWKSLEKVERKEVGDGDEEGQGEG